MPQQPGISNYTLICVLTFVTLFELQIALAVLRFSGFELGGHRPWVRAGLMVVPLLMMIFYIFWGRKEFEKVRHLGGQFRVSLSQSLIVAGWMVGSAALWVIAIG